MDVRFSFIIPHKNTPELLERCINSIPSREDLEIIIVDDASDESIVDFDNFPGKQDSRVKIIYSKDGKGAGAARNVGLDCAKGRWIVFSDADDFFNYCIRDILEEYKDDNSDVIYFNANSVDTKYYVNTNRSLQLNHFIRLYQKDKEKAIRLLRFRFGEPWAKMINRELIKKYNIQFDEVIVHNDTMFALNVGYFSNLVLVDNRAIYCCTTRENSLSYSTSSQKRLTRIYVFGRVEKFFRDNNINLSIIYKHIISMTYFLFFEYSSFLEGLSILKNLGFSKLRIISKMIVTFPYFLADQNKKWIKKIYYRNL
jgi:glycosyltransferase involved in cell wall biosynthesis